ncbi:hypothetical protein VE01_00774 [Pseudogymnoascus verrucosus]|uniref:Uncharacterized protein n=1 Tax=Pseudogymnoascus verrucosus TaxID=342668 RepID=A0A2P2SXH1_9PEZI|nr:uncharacterized protein VE01_00774 [Pseudogymnoascus verrucosus]OBU00953.2 hypothetical protein VE01_00774 [Pseudogymnoascus verrucosus]
MTTDSGYLVIPSARPGSPWRNRISEWVLKSPPFHQREQSLSLTNTRNIPITSSQQTKPNETNPQTNTSKLKTLLKMAGLLGNLTNSLDNTLTGGDEAQGKGGLLGSVTGAVGQTVDGAGQAVGQTTRGVGNIAGGATNTVGGLVGGATGQGGQAAQGAAGQGGQAAQGAVGQGQQAAQGVAGQTRNA